MQSRRDVIRMGVSVATVGGITSLAGCSNVPIVGSYFEDGLDYTEWAYDPAELDKGSLSLTVQNVQSLLEEDEVPNKSDMRDEVTSNYSDALSADDVQSVLTVGQSEILTGSFDGGAVVDETGLSEEDSYGEFDIYADDESEGGKALVATDGEYLIRSPPAQYYEFEAREELELLIDTYNGDVDGYIDVSENFETVQGELESGDITFVNASTESSAEEAPDDQTVATGVAVAVDGAETTGQYVLLYKAESGVDIDEAESSLKEQLSEEAELNDVSQDGRVVTAEYTAPTEEF